MARLPIPARSGRSAAGYGPPWLRGAARALSLPLGSIVIAFVLGAAVLLITGNNPLRAYGDLLCGGIGIGCGDNGLPAYQISESIVYTIPLIFTGLSVALAFRAGLFNIGGEGQLVMGVIASVFVGIHFASWPGWLLLPFVLLAGALAGAVWGGIAGVLRATTGANEVVTTIMLNYIAIRLSQYLVDNGPLQAAGQHAQSQSIGVGGQLPPLIAAKATLFGLAGGVYRAHTGIFLALIVAGVVWYLLNRTTLGYEIRAVGQSPRAARYAGISGGRTIIITMLLAGALSGLAGAVQVAGLRHNITDIYAVDSTGFDAIGVALLGQNAAIGVVLAALLFGALHVGGLFMQGDTGISANLVLVLQAFILFCIAANFLRNTRWNLLRLPPWGRRPAPADPERAATVVGEPPPAEAAGLREGTT